jgi:hypothetical protein
VAGTAALCALQPVGNLHAADTPLAAASTARRREPLSGVRGLGLSLAAAMPAFPTMTILVLASLLSDVLALLRVATVDTTCRHKTARRTQNVSGFVLSLQARNMVPFSAYKNWQDNASTARH